VTKFFFKECQFWYSVCARDLENICNCVPCQSCILLGHGFAGKGVLDWTEQSLVRLFWTCLFPVQAWRHSLTHPGWWTEYDCYTSKFWNTHGFRWWWWHAAIVCLNKEKNIDTIMVI